MIDLSIENLQDLIDRNNLLWERSLSGKKITMWLENFCGRVMPLAEERSMAFELLRHFMYFSESEVKYLCQVALSMLTSRKIKDNPTDYLGEDGRLLIEEYLRRCRFSYIGRVGESGGFILSYYFRQINNLAVSQLFEPVLLSTISHDENPFMYCPLIFIDDFLGTGHTAREFWEANLQPIKDVYSDMEFFYMPLVAMKFGVNYIRKYTEFEVICPQVLNEEYRVFSNNSMVFPQIEKRNTAKEICYGYGCSLVKERDALGYRNSQTLLGFHHNIPDNTLPIIWCDNNWHPIFRRAKKKY